MTEILRKKRYETLITQDRGIADAVTGIYHRKYKDRQDTETVEMVNGEGAILITVEAKEEEWEELKEASPDDEAFIRVSGTLMEFGSLYKELGKDELYAAVLVDGEDAHTFFKINVYEKDLKAGDRVYVMTGPSETTPDGRYAEIERIKDDEARS